jgi:hypothetical protein
MSWHWIGISGLCLWWCEISSITWSECICWFYSTSRFQHQFFQREPIGILVYELRNTRRFNKDVISSEDEATRTQLVIIWKVNSSKEFQVSSRLIEHDKDHVGIGMDWWDQSSLSNYMKYNLYLLKGYI